MSLSLLDWRRRVHALYAEVARQRRPGRRRTSCGGAAATSCSPATRTRRCCRGDRAAFAGLPFAPYDPALRFEAVVDADAEPHRLEVPTATDGVVPFERIGVRAPAPTSAQPGRVVARLATAAGCSCR